MLSAGMAVPEAGIGWPSILRMALLLGCIQSNDVWSI